MFESDVRKGICNEILSEFLPRFEYATHQHKLESSKKPETKSPEVGFQNEKVIQSKLQR